MSGERPLGLRLKDEDHKYLEDESARPTFAADDTPVPKTIDLRGVIKLDNQLEMGSCGGHAGAHGAAGLNWICSAGDSVQRFSRMFLYLMAQKLDGLLGRDQGCTISGLVKAMKTYGVCLEKDFQYPARYHTNVPQSALKAASGHKLIEHVKFRNYEEVFHFMSRKHGVVLGGIPWTTGWDQCNGVAERSNVLSGRERGGHAQAWLGYSNRRDRSGRKYLWQANSHGDRWANGGWCETSPDLLQMYIDDRNSEIIGIRLFDVVMPETLDVRIGG